MTSSTAKTVPTAGPVHRPPRSRAILAFGVGVVLAILLAYVVGRLQSSAKIDEIEANRERAIEAEQQTSAKLQADLAAERSHSGRLEARRSLHLALSALDDRNFGIAETQLKNAANLLERSKLEPGSELEKLKSGIAAYKLAVSEDLGAQRTQLLGWIKKFDQIVTPRAEQ